MPSRAADALLTLEVRAAARTARAYLATPRARNGSGAVWAPCTTTPTATSLPACARGMTLAQSFGTSWAAPHVAGLAALLVAQIGHDSPAEIRARILESADDLGEPGMDPFYGRGRINAARALGVVPD